MPDAELHTEGHGDEFLGALVPEGSWVDSASRQSLRVVVWQDSGLGGAVH